MARKPIHLQAAGKLTPRDRIWAAIRALASIKPPVRFTLDDISRMALHLTPKGATRRRIEVATITTYLAGLVAAGYLRCDREPGEPPRFFLMRDVGIEAPRVTKDGKPVTQGRRRDALWLTMKHIKSDFSHSELARAASTASNAVADADAASYVHFLALAGYLVLTTACKPGTQARYRFVAARNTGPRAPQIQRVKHVYDPNLGAVVWHPQVNS